MTFRRVESTPGILTVRYKDKPIWLFIRNVINLHIISKRAGGYSMSHRTRSKTRLMRNFTYGLTNIFRLTKYKYWFFSNTDKRNLIDGKYKDIFFDEIADKLGQRNCLFIEYAISGFYKNTYSAYSLNDLIFKTVGRIIGTFISIKKIKNIELLERALKDNDISFNIRTLTRFMLGEYLLYHILFKYKRPKAIFVLCYYTKIPMIVAAKEYDIPVYESQHGVITSDNAAYSSIPKGHQDFFPDYLLSFGRDLKNGSIENFIYTPDVVIPLGSYYLGYIDNHFKRPQIIEELKGKYRKIICVTLSGLYNDSIMKFVLWLSEKYKDYIFILRPKYQEEIVSYLTDNIITLEGLNIYQVLKFSDFNITIQSFVAYEADYLGVYNILFNFNGLSRQFIHPQVYGEFVDPDDYEQFEFPDNPERDDSNKLPFFVSFEENVGIVSEQIKQRHG